MKRICVYPESKWTPEEWARIVAASEGDPGEVFIRSGVKKAAEPEVQVFDRRKVRGGGSK